MKRYSYINLISPIILMRKARAACQLYLNLLRLKPNKFLDLPTLKAGRLVGDFRFFGIKIFSIFFIFFASTFFIVAGSSLLLAQPPLQLKPQAAFFFYPEPETASSPFSHFLFEPNFSCDLLLFPNPWLQPAETLAKTSAQTSFITIVDAAKRKVTIPSPIERIVALNGSLRYVVYLQAFDKVVGIEGIEINLARPGQVIPGRPYQATIAEKALKLPLVGEGGPGKLPDFEALLTIKPDVVLTFEAANAELIQKKTGIPSLVLSYAGTEGIYLEQLESGFTFLGKLLGREQRSAELNQFLESCRADLEKRTANCSAPSVYIGAISARGSHGITSTEADYPPLRWIKAANVADRSGQRGHLFIDKEQLIVWDPEYLFIDAGGLALVNEDYLKNKEFYLRLRAVRAGKVYTLFPFNFYRTNLETLIANSYFIGKVLYPERFAEVEIEKKAREIFRAFLGVDVFDSLKKGYADYGRVEFKESGLEVRPEVH